MYGGSYNGYILMENADTGEILFQKIVFRQVSTIVILPKQTMHI